MRRRNSNESISVHAISGTHVVLLGLDLRKRLEDVRSSLVGFAIHRTEIGSAGGGGSKPTSTTSNPLSPDPIRKFLWGDYAARPGTRYSYTVRAILAGPRGGRRLAAADSDSDDAVTVTIETENPDEGTHGIYFNRGAAGSQRYSERFASHRRYYLSEKYGRERWESYIKPETVPNGEAFKWLSRGLEEGLLKFVGQADGPRYKIRASVYELTHGPVLEAFAAALERGVDVKIVRHYKRTARAKVRRDKIIVDDEGRVVKEHVPDEVTADADRAIRRVGIESAEYTRAWQHEVFVRRTAMAGLSHNKFIVLVKDDAPVQVWTGSTNFTAGGIYGQSNVGHVVRDETVAGKYLEYWEKLSADPKKARKNARAESDPDKMGFDRFVERLQPDLVGPIERTDDDHPSVRVVFSPRSTTSMLRWYADRVGDARNSVHFTAAFGVCQEIAEVFNRPGGGGATGSGVDGETPSFLRHVLLESRPSKRKSDAAKEKAAGRGEPPPVDFFDYAKVPDNRIAYGDLLDEKKTDRARAAAKRGRARPVREESLSGLNTFVDYLHTKYLLIDPLTDDPTVVTGSANFSDASTDKNDENMLVIHGDMGVADVYLTEFMRLFNHFYSRNRWSDRDDDASDDDEEKEEEDLAEDFAKECSLSGRGGDDDGGGPAAKSWTDPYFDPTTQEFRERLLFR